MSERGGDFLHLNRDGGWPGFARRSLEADAEGGLALASLPAFTGGRAAAGALAALPAPGGPEGLAVAADGTVLWTDAAAGRLLRRDSCDGREAPAPLDPDAGLAEPRGLAIHPGLGVVIVADAGRHRLVLIALGSYQVAGVWGGPGSGPGSEPGELDRPLGVAVDGEGAVYVADAGNRRLQKLGRDGAPDPAFEAAVAGAAPDLERPEALAFDGGLLWVLDPAVRAVFAFAPDGSAAGRFGLASAAPGGLAVDAGALYAGDNAGRRILRIDPGDGRVLGEARGFEGPVAALAVRGDGLWVHPGGGAAPVRLELRGAAVRQGALWGGPVELGGEPHDWQRLQALGDPGGGRVVFFVHAGDSAPPDPDPARLGEPDGGFDPAAWRRIGEGAGDVLAGERSERLWIGALLAGDGRSGPRVEQLRISFDESGYAEHLPAIYRVPEKVFPNAPPGSRETLERLLALFESFFDDTEEAIAGLRRLFDPATAPSGWLDWLASWLAYDLDEGWPVAKKRRLIAAAFAFYGWRGTARGLARALGDRLGVPVSIEEPHAQAGWWLLGGGAAGGSSRGCAHGSSCGCACSGANRGASTGALGARLGLGTRLAPAAPEGAVLGTTAVLDRSHLIEEEDVGEPLFTHTAYQFTVVVPRSRASAPATLAQVREVVEREKPAHTTYRICLVEPGLRVGYQALLGVDTLVGGGPAPVSRLGEPSPGGLVLGGETPGRLGAGRVGRSTRLGEGTFDAATGARRPVREETSWAQ